MSLQQTIENIWDNRDFSKRREQNCNSSNRSLDERQIAYYEPTENGSASQQIGEKSSSNVFPIQKMETIKSVV